jgi:1-pyrroline-5-carboxylate dehydrogenase
MGRDFLTEVDELAMGPVTDFANFLGAVIDERAFARVTSAIERARQDPTVEIGAGGNSDDSDGWFIRPTVLLCSDPTSEYFRVEYFGPLLAVHVFEDSKYDDVVRQMESAAPYALTGSIIAQDRAAIDHAMTGLRFAAGNFYINDKPTGAVVGQQPFGGARASGTNDKAGSAANLLRWTSVRSIKETFVPPTDYRYPHQG